MAYATNCNSIIRKEFFKPLFDYLPAAKHRRDCPALDDATWMEAGIRCCLGIFQSGSDFLQQLSDLHHTDIGLSTLSESFKIKRRLDPLNEVLAHSRFRMRRDMPDAFASFPCLEDFDLYAGDGHAIAAACHDVAKPRGNTPSPADCKTPGATSSTTTRTAVTK